MTDPDIRALAQRLVDPATVRVGEHVGIHRAADGVLFVDAVIELHPRDLASGHAFRWAGFPTAMAPHDFVDEGPVDSEALCRDAVFLGLSPGSRGPCLRKRAAHACADCGQAASLHEETSRVQQQQQPPEQASAAAKACGECGSTEHTTWAPECPKVPF